MMFKASTASKPVRKRVSAEEENEKKKILSTGNVCNKIEANGKIKLNLALLKTYSTYVIYGFLQWTNPNQS